MFVAIGPAPLPSDIPFTASDLAALHDIISRWCKDVATREASERTASFLRLADAELARQEQDGAVAFSLSHIPGMALRGVVRFFAEGGAAAVLDAETVAEQQDLIAGAKRMRAIAVKMGHPMD